MVILVRVYLLVGRIIIVPDRQSEQSTFFTNLKKGLFCRCPKCGVGKAYDGLLNLKDQCDVCDLKIGRNDIGDGAIVFLVFVLGFVLVPLAIWVDFKYEPSVLTHVFLWGVLGISATVALLRPTKTYILALIYCHRPDMWDEVKGHGDD